MQIIKNVIATHAERLDFYPIKKLYANWLSITKKKKEKRVVIKTQMIAIIFCRLFPSLTPCMHCNTLIIYIKAILQSSCFVVIFSFKLTPIREESKVVSKIQNYSTTLSTTFYLAISYSKFPNIFFFLLFFKKTLLSYL